jgi:hypothetical protein
MWSVPRPRGTKISGSRLKSKPFWTNLRPSCRVLHRQCERRDGDQVLMNEASHDALNSVAPAATSVGEQGKTDTFCILPFQHLCIGTEGTARICCASDAYVSHDDTRLSLYTTSFQEIWNSAFMREVRRKMLNGGRLSECVNCYQHEAATSNSYRTYANSLALSDHPLDRTRLKDKTENTNYHMEERPSYIKLELGNLCNLKCRMCNTSASSEVERDPVHSMWAGGRDPLHAIWDGNEAVIGPQPKIGVARGGVYATDKVGNDWVNWTGAVAQFDLPLSATTRLDRLVIKLNCNLALERTCVIRINGQIGYEGPANVSPISINLQNVSPSDGLKIDVMSTTVFNWQRKRDEGLPLISIVLHRASSTLTDKAKEPVCSRLGKPGLWYNDDKLLFDELMGDPQKLRRLVFAGAEPLLEPRYADVAAYLIDSGVAQKIDLEVITNATIINKPVLDNLKRFKSLHMQVSLDGIGAVQEYIRYPARWPVVENNIRILKEDYGFNVVLIPTVQAYNMLSLADIYSFARKADIGISCANVLQYPDWLRVSVMPKSAHRLAAARLRKILEAGVPQPWQREEVKSLIDHFESFDVPIDEAALRTFNEFTNDLDVSRGQRFQQSLPELYGLIIKSGYEWTDRTLHAYGDESRQTARERLHAWV